MHFSCKVTNTILTYLEDQGEDISPLYDHTPLALELLRDPSYWISAHDLEHFLNIILQNPWNKSFENLIQIAGHEGPTIRAWGVLDSVLRMMPKPQEIFHQPERFLSYFISPQPPIENLIKNEVGISFDLPLPAEQYPLVTSYFKAAFESLPVYVGQNPAFCRWEGIHIELFWPQEQKTIFQNDPGHQISPSLISNVVEELQKNQLELEEKNRELQKKNEELTQAHKDLEKHLRNENDTLLPEEPTLGNFHFTSVEPGYIIGQNLARLHDYMVRAQQLITMLASQGKMTPAVKEAMRRVDWEYVKNQYPRTISETVENLRKIQTQINQQPQLEESSHVRNH